MEKATVVMTYNFVDGYPNGIYKGKHNDVMVRGSGLYINEVEEMCKEITHEKVEKVYYYFGSRFHHDRTVAARKLVRAGNKLTIVACGCDWPYKQWLVAHLKVSIIGSECGGVETLGDIVRRELEA